MQASGWWWGWLVRPCSSLLLGVSSFSTFSSHGPSDLVSTLFPWDPAMPLLGRCTHVLCHPSFLCPAPWTALGLCGHHTQHGGQLSCHQTTTSLQETSILAEQSRKPCLPQPLVLPPSCPLAWGTWLSACRLFGHLHHHAPKLLCQHPLIL